MAAVSLRYARAFASVVASMKLDAAAVQQQVQDFAATLAGSHELREFLMDPSAPQEQKVRAIDAIAGKLKMGPQVRNFFAVITAHQRLHEVHEIVDEYIAAANEQAGLAKAEVTSARALNAEDCKLLEQRIAVLAGASQGKVRATYHEDPALLGGAVIRIGSTVYDGSVRAQLQQLKQRLMAAQVS